MMIKHTLTGDAGELSPWLDGRTDLAKYNAGFQRLENFIVLPQGGVMKRPGLEAVGTVPGNVGGSAAVAATETTPAILAVPPSPATTGVLIEFQVSSAYGVVLALGGREMRAWVDGVPKVMVTKAGPPVVTFSTLTIPWLDADLPKLRWKQINDVMYFVHPDYPMWRLRRETENNWTLWPVDFLGDVPLLKENTLEKWTIECTFPVIVTNAWAAGVNYVVGQMVTYVSKTWRCTWANLSKADWAPGTSTATWKEPVTAGNTAFYYTNAIWVEVNTDTSSLPGQDVTLKATVDTWTDDHIGSVWELAKRRNSSSYEVVLTATSANNGQYSPILVVKGEWTFETYGTWYGTFRVERSIDRGVTWEEVRKYSSGSGALSNYSSEGREKTRVLLRIKWAHGTSGDSNPYARLTAVETKLRGIVKIKSVTNPREVIATTVTPVESGITPYWSQGAWSKAQGYPSCLETHQGRLVVAATREKPHSVWGSAIDDYPNFYIGTDADMAYWHTIPVGERDPILWLVSEKQLLIGTGSGEFIMGGEDENGAITPEFGTAKRQSSHGSHDGGASAIFSDSVALFIQRGGTRVREYSYRFDQDRYDASNLNILADHLFANKPITDVAVQRMPFQVVWFLSDGKLYGLTYERQQNVVAWHRHSTQGEIISIATLRTSGPEDEVWLLVKRSGVFHLERFRRGSFTDPQNVDAHWKDGTAGLSYTSIYQPMTPEIPLANGSSRTREFRIHRIVPSLYRSRGGKYGQLPTGILYPLGAGSSSALFTGEIEKGFPGMYSTNDGLCLVSDEPYPFSIRSVAIKFNVLGDAD